MSFGVEQRGRGRVLVTGGRSPVALGVTRLFREAGYVVFGADCIKNTLVSFSNNIYEYITTPPPSTDLVGYEKFICNLVKEKNIDLIVPVCEEVFYLASFKDRLPEGCAIFCSTMETLNLLHSKFTFIECARSLGVNTPKTILVESVGQMRDVLSSTTHELFIKPVYSRFGAYARKVDSTSNVSGLNIGPDNPWVVQEFIAGKEFCSYSCFQNGEILNHVTYSSPYHLNFGAHFLYRAVENKNVLRTIELIGKKLNLTGNFGFDFIENEMGKLYPIECNPRPTSGINLFFEKPKIFANSIYTGKKGLIIEKTSKFPQIKLMMIYYLFGKVRNINGLKLWLNDFINGKDVIFKINDPLPAIMLPYIFLYLFIKSIKFGVSRKEMTSAGIRYDGQIK